MFVTGKEQQTHFFLPLLDLKSYRALLISLKHSGATAKDKEYAASSLWNLSYDQANCDILKVSTSD